MANHPAPDIPPEEVGYIADKIVKAERRIAAYPWDAEAWSILIRDAQMKTTDQGRATYERAVAQFPNAGRYWKVYIEHEMKSRNFEKVEKLFQRCLMKVLNIDLWKTYLGYIKETKGNSPTYREKMAQAYDFALDKIGMDIMSHQIWGEYIGFLKSVEAVGSYAENQRITAVRKVFQRGVVNPMINIEMLWKEYIQFENTVNPLIAKKMQEDRGREYLNARRVAKEYEAVTKGLNRNAPTVPPQNTPEEAKQVELWKRYITWEKNNPMRTEDHATITRRVMFAYEQCLLCLGHHPDIWIEAAAYLEHSSRLLAEKGDQNAGKLFADEAAAMYERAITNLLRDNMLIYFAYADFEESRNKHEKVHNIYKRLIALEEIDPTLPYIQFMKFARRAEGIKSARTVFKLCREDQRAKFHVYIAAALMEYYCSKDKNVAFKIFELGLKKYGNQPEYCSAYVDYMSHINEDNNTRVLFERVLSSGQLPADQTHEIWNKFLEFESNVGDLSSIVKVEKRRMQVLGSEYQGKETALLIDRYKYLSLYPCSEMELRALGYKGQGEPTVQGQAVPQHTVHEKGGKSAPEKVVKKMLPQYPMPDVYQMIPFKPKPNPLPGSHPVEGGVFPPPPVAAELLTKLPPPESFKGPFIILDKFIDTLKNMNLTPDILRVENGVDMKNVDTGTQLSIDIAMGRKRKISKANEDESDEDDSTTAPPAHDLYRSRQQKKVK